jgi:thioredoxin 1
MKRSAGLLALGAILAITVSLPAAAMRRPDVDALRNGGKVENASNRNFDATVLRSDEPVLVEFWAPWCIVCKQLDQPLELLAAKFNFRARIVRVNVDWNQKIAQRFKVQALPTVLVFKDGVLVSRTTGGASMQDLEDLLTPTLQQPIALLASQAVPGHQVDAVPQ